MAKAVTLGVFLLFGCVLGYLNRDHGPCQTQLWPQPYSVTNGSTIAMIDPSQISVRIQSQNSSTQITSKIKDIISEFTKTNFFTNQKAPNKEINSYQITIELLSNYESVRLEIT